MINNWEAVYKKLIFKSIIELAGNLNWDEVAYAQVRRGGMYRWGIR